MSAHCSRCSSAPKLCETCFIPDSHCPATLTPNSQYQKTSTIFLDLWLVCFADFCTYSWGLTADIPILSCSVTSPIYIPPNTALSPATISCRSAASCGSWEHLESGSIALKSIATDPGGRFRADYFFNIPMALSFSLFVLDLEGISTITITTNANPQHIQLSKSSLIPYSNLVSSTFCYFESILRLNSQCTIWRTSKHQKSTLFLSQKACPRILPDRVREDMLLKPRCFFNTKESKGVFLHHQSVHLVFGHHRAKLCL